MGATGTAEPCVCVWGAPRCVGAAFLAGFFSFFFLSVVTQCVSVREGDPHRDDADQSHGQRVSLDKETSHAQREVVAMMLAPFSLFVVCVSTTTTTTTTW